MSTMGTTLLFMFFVLVGPLAVLYGVDSSVYEDRPRSWSR
jgi:hypothetical protein